MSGAAQQQPGQGRENRQQRAGQPSHAAPNPSTGTKRDPFEGAKLPSANPAEKPEQIAKTNPNTSVDTSWGALAKDLLRRVFVESVPVIRDINFIRQDRKIDHENSKLQEEARSINTKSSYLAILPTAVSFAAASYFISTMAVAITVSATGSLALAVPIGVVAGVTIAAWAAKEIGDSFRESMKSNYDQKFKKMLEEWHKGPRIDPRPENAVELGAWYKSTHETDKKKGTGRHHQEDTTTQTAAKGTSGAFGTASLGTNANRINNNIGLGMKVGSDDIGADNIT